MWPNVPFTMSTIARAQVTHTPCNLPVFGNAPESFGDAAFKLARSIAEARVAGRTVG